jgi:ribosome biogenesis protein MAK21
MVERLLSQRPEQEKHLLELIVDKLGDPDSNVAAKTLHLLTQLCKKKYFLILFSIYFN